MKVNIRYIGRWRDLYGFMQIFSCITNLNRAFIMGFYKSTAFGGFSWDTPPPQRFFWASLMLWRKERERASSSFTSWWKHNLNAENGMQEDWCWISSNFKTGGGESQMQSNFSKQGQFWKLSDCSQLSSALEHTFSPNDCVFNGK